MSKHRHKWRKINKRQLLHAEALLRSQEDWCINACNKFINRNDSQESTIWVLSGIDGTLSALIIYSGQSLLPVFCEQDLPLQHFIRTFIARHPVYSVQGRYHDVRSVEMALAQGGLFATETIDYDLMSLNFQPTAYQTAGPPGLIIRQARADDMDGLAAMHAAYEQEEVLPAAAVFNAAVSRMHIERIYKQQHILVAERGGRLMGKINTNAMSFTRSQIGGVYVHPDCRCMGIGRRMAGEFAASLIDQGWGISLFVKKSNTPARRVYQCIGFEILGDYRISYF